jgi:monothiol glutaredoxin
MTRHILNENALHPAIRERVSKLHRDVVEEVQDAIAKHAVVVIGMGLNPFPKKARKMLEGIGQHFHYIEFGNYFTQWRERNALKLWTGWPTFPMIFVKGSLVGGAMDLKALIDQGDLKELLSQKAH